MRQHKLTQNQTTAASLQPQAATSAKSPTHPVLQLQAEIGNRAVNRLIEARHGDSESGATQYAKRGAVPQSEGVPISKEFDRISAGTTVPTQIMAKLMIGPAKDKYEQEADRVASEVVSRKNEMHSKDDEMKLMRSSREQSLSGNGGMAATPDLEASIQQARSSGQPLADNIRKPMERAFGTDFGGVKVYTDAQSDQLNRGIQARAFTTGQDIFFRQGEYNPGSSRGQELIAHELTHVVQQRKEAIQPFRLIQRTLATEEEIKKNFNAEEQQLLDEARKKFNDSLEKKERNQKFKLTEQIVMQNIGDIVEMMALPTIKELYQEEPNIEIWTNVQFSIDGGKEYKEPELDFLVLKDEKIYRIGSIKSNSSVFSAKKDREFYEQFRNLEKAQENAENAEKVGNSLKETYKAAAAANNLYLTYTLHSVKNDNKKGEKRRIKYQDFQNIPQDEKLYIDLVTPKEKERKKTGKSQKMTNWDLDHLKQWLALGNQDYKEFYKGQKENKK